MNFVVDLLSSLGSLIDLQDPAVEMQELPLDPRWEQVEDGDGSQWYFRGHDTTNHFVGGDEEDDQKRLSRFTAPSVSVNDLVSHIQTVHRTAFDINTATELATAFRSTANQQGRRTTASTRSGSAVLLQNRSKTRRIKKVKHEIEMNRRRHEYNKKRLDYLLYTLDNRHAIRPDTFVLEQEKEEDEKVGKKKPVPSFHLLHDFEEIQQLYDECVLDVLNIEQNMKMMNRRTQAEIDAENETLTKFVRAYLWGPIEKDEYYREINNSIFQEFDQDPIQMILEEGERSHFDSRYNASMGSEDIHVNNVYPKLEVMSKRTMKDRQDRRKLLLSIGDEDSEYDIEVERISALLSQMIQ